ncbi:tripartite tricarboxylate transporter substrate binding protein [Shumkonia mesophila]|uniref:tripartite tricarboxylate transporter substrate binding protein n=1 Tax=Shumkonia mesophila TaxID=2838854 RepID=UPI002934CF95|nr:tripartite tricarboxylate transporter substrate binding protein [Shumkonia mesophila]
MEIGRAKLLGMAAALALSTTLGTAQVAQAQDAKFPSKAVQFIVPYSAGGGQDQWARMIASAAQKYMGQPMNVEVRAGAGGTVGWRYLLDQPADGYTIMIGSISPMIAVLGEKKPPVPIDAVRMVNIVSDFNPQLLSAPGTEWDTWDKLVAYAKQNPNRLTVGGTLAQALAAAAVFDQAGIKANFIPYSGTSQAVTDMLGKHISLSVVTPTTAVSLGDKAKAVLNVGDLPNGQALKAALGNVPWAGDLGYKGVAQPRWIGVHPKTPDDIVAKLDAGIKATLGDSVVVNFVTKSGEEVIYSDHRKAQATYDAMVASIRKLLPLLK